MYSFLELHQLQLELCVVPEHFWDTLRNKLETKQFDAENVFDLWEIDYRDCERTKYDRPFNLIVKAEDGIRFFDPSQIYLIEHAWTFEIENGRRNLNDFECLRKRMASIMGIDCNLERGELVDKIYNEMWKYCDCYWTGSIDNVDDRVAHWHIMDEIGCAIKHSKMPNFKVVSFTYAPEDITYSLMFPIQDLNYGDVVTRNCVGRPIEDQNEQLAFSLPWEPYPFLDVGYENEIPSPDYFLSDHIEESLPILSKQQKISQPKTEYKVFTEYGLIQEYLSDVHFVFVDNEDEADILWYTRHFKNYEQLCKTPHKRINQFPYEFVLAVKDLLCVVCRRTSSPAWLPITYNLKTELPRFVNYYQHRKCEGLNNHWIIKPYSYPKDIDIHITDNLNLILRLPMSGPKIAQKYIEHPVLFYRDKCKGKVKFDICCVILLKNVKPLEAYAYKKLILSFADQPFEMNEFDVYPKHFTMNYIDNPDDSRRILYATFKSEWEKQYPNILWDDIEKKILNILRQVLERATMEHPPCGISESPQSRSMYTADIMLQWNGENEVQPMLLDVNWIPDCKRACEYYEDFFNDIFKLLFLDIYDSDIFYKL